MANNVIIGVPGPQGPPGPTGPTGPGGGGAGGNNVSIIGNVAGAPALVSSGTLFLAGGNNVTLSQNGQSITISGASTVPGGIAASMGGNTAGAPSLVSSGTLVLAGGNNVTLSQNGNSITISANTAAAANLSVSAGSTSGPFGGLTFSNGSGVSFGLNNGTITASVAAQSIQTQAAGNIGATGFATTTTGGSLIAGTNNTTGFTLAVPAFLTTQSVQTQASGNIAGVGTTFSGTNISGSMTLNSGGLNLALSGAAGGSGASTVGIYAAGNTTGQSSSSTGAQSSLNLSFAGIVSGGWSSNTFVISSPGTTGLTQLSAGMSTGGNTAGTTGLASAQLVLAGGANITLSGSTNAGSMTISIAGGAGGGGGGVGFGVSTAGNTAGATGTVTTGNVVLVGSGPISLSQATGAAGSAATITINGPATSSISGTGLVSISVNGSTISIGANALTAYAVSNTTQSTSGTVNGTALSFAGAGGVSVGVSNGSVVISGGAGGGAAASAGVSTGGNTSGNTGIYSGQVVFAGGNNITLSVSSGAAGAQTITISGANAGGAQTGISGIIVSNTTYTSGTVSFSNANGISFGSSAGQAITASYTQSAQAFSAQGGSSTFSTLAFTNSNGVSFSNTNGSIWGSVAAQTNQTVGLYAVGNTTQNSSTTLDARTLSFDGLGAMTVGYSNGSVQLSAPAISSISGTGQVSVSVNGSTISIGVPNQVTNTDFFAPYEDIQLAPAQIGQGSLIIDPQPFPNVQFDRILFPIYNTNSSLSSGSHSLSFYMGLYSRNASTLSLLGSTSLSTALTQSGTVGSYSLYSGVRGFTVGSTATLTSGNYWIGFASRTSSAGADGSYSNLALNGGFFTDSLLSGTLSYGGYFGSAVNATNQQVLGQGFYTATTTGMPASIAFSQINGTASNAGNMQGMVFASSTV